MSIVPIPTELFVYPPLPGAPSARSPKSRTKGSAASAWAAWEETESASCRSEFLRYVSSWTEGTAAQLLRQSWPASAVRPSAMEVQERLCRYLEAAARGEHVSYLEALEQARRGVIEELRSARRPAADPDLALA
jgi:predicted transcriptional regulator